MKILLNVKKNYYSILFVFVLVYSSFLLQQYIIYPIEKKILGSSAIDYVSIFYLPHGFKIVLFFIFRKISIMPIFLATYLYSFTLIFNLSHFLGSIIGVLSIYIAFSFCSYLLKGSDTDYYKTSIWRVLLVVVVISSLINSILQSMIASYQFKEYNLNLFYLCGDILGSLTVIGLVILLRQKILRIIT